MSKKKLSTYERFMKAHPKQKMIFEEEYRELLLSEIVIALMEEDDISVRKLAKEAGISPTIIQELRTGKKKNLTLKTLSKIAKALGYSIILIKEEGDRPPIHLKAA